ncbi:MAG: flagellar protein FliT [Paraclostridium sp.]
MEDLKRKLEEYEKITIEIDLLLDVEYELIDGKLNKRQLILDSISEAEKLEAHKIYFEMKLDKLDERIREKIMVNLEVVKEEIKEYRKTKMVNSMYSRNSREKLNIFSKKV